MVAGEAAGEKDPMLIESRSLAELAADRISALVYRGDLAPGSRLVEEDLCRRLGVSRAPVREALRLLEANGLVVRRPRAGVTVALLDQNDVFEILTFRASLEHMAVDHLYRWVGVGNADTTELDAALAGLGEAFGTEDDFERLEASHRFHTALVALCGNSRLIGSYAGLTTQVKVCMTMNLRQRESIETPADNVARHRLLRDEVLSGDVARAHAAFDAHGHDSFAFPLIHALPGSTPAATRWLESLTPRED
ncbi:GntR family transcriptional regulator [Brevibacterium samyangense]|uniref:GntR family transcriptional regulator n=1 Tax=Brevibacterium samyangense TaxID=366888 RepID=UPI0031DE30E8